MTRQIRRNGIFYGWFIVAAGFFSLFVTTGARNGFGVFIIPMTDEFGWSRGTISIAIAIGWFVNGVSQPFLGRLVDRYGGRRVISASLLIIGSCTMLLSQTNNIWFLIAIYGFVISIAAGGASLVTIHVVLARWFYRRRSIVLSISTAGATAGALVLAPFASYLILFAGWRISWFALGAIVLFLAFPLALLFIRDDPSKLGELPDGDVETFTDGVSSRRSSERRGPLETENWADSYRTVPMWQLTGAYFVCGMTTAIISAHFVPYAIDKDISPEIAALAFGMMSGFNIVGVLLAGSLSGKLGTKNTLGAVYALRGVAYSMLLFMPGSIGIWLFALIAGFSWIASASLTSSLTAEIYGLRNMGTLGGMATFAHQMGGALSIFLGGVMYDWLGSYFVPFGIAGSLLIGASIAGFTIKEKKYSARYQPVTAQPAIAPAGDGD